MKYAKGTVLHAVCYLNVDNNSQRGASCSPNCVCPKVTFCSVAIKLQHGMFRSTSFVPGKQDFYGMLLRRFWISRLVEDGPLTLTLSYLYILLCETPILSLSFGYLPDNGNGLVIVLLCVINPLLISERQSVGRDHVELKIIL